MKRTLLFCLTFFCTLGLMAANFTVDSTTDASDANAGDGMCDDGSGNCTLRAAIEEANALAGADNIDLPAGTYTLTTSAQLTVSSDITIRGAGQNTTIIQAHASAGSATWRVLGITTDGTDFHLQDVTIRHGRVADHGGGLHADLGVGASGNITFLRVTFTLNETISGGARDGGGFYLNNDFTSLTFTECTISNNTAADDGGGFRPDGAVVFSMTDCIISNNSAGGDPTENAAGGGGQLNAAGGGGTFTRCTFSGNSTTNNDGGGVNCANGDWTFINCVFTGNSTTSGNGGAININDPTFAPNSLNLFNCTIVDNTAGGTGGGINFDTGAGQAAMTNCIVANNSDGSANDVNFNDDASLNTNTTNLVENCTTSGGGSCPTFTYTSDPNLTASTTCGLQTVYYPLAPSDALNNGTAPGGSIPTDDICSITRQAPYDIGAAEGANGALDLDGTDDYVDYGDVDEIDNISQMTVEFWVKFDILAENDRIVSDHGAGSSTAGWHVGLGGASTGGSDDIKFTINPDGLGAHHSYTTGNIISTGHWYHIAVKWDGTQGNDADKVAIFVNSEEQSLTTGSSLGSVLPANTHSLALGARSDGTANFMDGQITEFRVWTILRTNAQIRNRTHYAVEETTADLEIYCPINHSDGVTNIEDISNNGTSTHNGTWMGSGGGSNTTSNFVDSTNPFVDFSGTGFTGNNRGVWSALGTGNASNGSDGFTMTAGTALTDPNWAVAGHDNGGPRSNNDDLFISSAVQRLDQIWEVEVNGTVSNMTLNFDLGTITNLPAAGVASNYRLLYRSGTTGNFNDVTVGSTSVVNTDQVEFTGVTLATGYYTLGTTDASASPLPVDLFDFYVMEHNGAVLLKWKTLSEVENRGWDILHSTDASNWNWIGFVEGAGYSDNELSYSYTHQEPVNGTNYYRLKQIDYDGFESYSHVESVEIIVGDEKAQIRVVPNPVYTSEFTLYLPENEASTIDMNLYDYSGRLIQNSILSGNQATVEVGDLIPGIYILQVQIEGERYWERVVIH